MDRFDHFYLQNLGIITDIQFPVTDKCVLDTS